MEDEARWTAGGRWQPAYADALNIQRLDESCEPRRERCGVMCDGVDTTRGNGVILARGEMRGTVVVRFA